MFSPPCVCADLAESRMALRIRRCDSSLKCGNIFWTEALIAGSGEKVKSLTSFIVSFKIAWQLALADWGGTGQRQFIGTNSKPRKTSENARRSHRPVDAVPGNPDLG